MGSLRMTTLTLAMLLSLAALANGNIGLALVCTFAPVPPPECLTFDFADLDFMGLGGGGSSGSRESFIIPQTQQQQAPHYHPPRYIHVPSYPIQGGHQGGYGGNQGGHGGYQGGHDGFRTPHNSQHNVLGYSAAGHDGVRLATIKTGYGSDNTVLPGHSYGGHGGGYQYGKK